MINPSSKRLIRFNFILNIHFGCVLSFFSFGLCSSHQKMSMLNERNCAADDGAAVAANGLTLRYINWVYAKTRHLYAKSGCYAEQLPSNCYYY